MAAQTIRPGSGLDTIIAEVNALIAAGTTDPLAVHGSEALRIVRGRVGSDGTKINGTGFTSAKNSAGDYTITLTTAFTSVPAMFVGVATAACGAQCAPSTGTDAVRTYDLTADGVAKDAAFSFVLVGAA